MLLGCFNCKLREEGYWAYFTLVNLVGPSLKSKTSNVPWYFSWFDTKLGLELHGDSVNLGMWLYNELFNWLYIYSVGWASIWHWRPKRYSSGHLVASNWNEMVLNLIRGFVFHSPNNHDNGWVNIDAMKPVELRINRKYLKLVQLLVVSISTYTIRLPMLIYWHFLLFWIFIIAIQ